MTLQSSSSHISITYAIATNDTCLHLVHGHSRQSGFNWTIFPLTNGLHSIVNLGQCSENAHCMYYWACFWGELTFCNNFTLKRNPGFCLWLGLRNYGIWQFFRTPACVWLIEGWSVDYWTLKHRQWTCIHCLVQFSNRHFCNAKTLCMYVYILFFCDSIGGVNFGS